ncbi:MAG: tetratricopeptide repeat protein [Candidatus Omnitrophica bacterium]|nr:tetratricopeptide repeat protein [Candidatus Omnitrophota bacterium]
MKVTNLNHKTAIIILIAFAFIVYANSLFNSFVWDDFLVIVNNNFVKSWNNFPLLFKRDYLNFLSGAGYAGKYNLGSGESSYRPVVTFSYLLDYSFWKLNPFGYHLTNVLLHILNVLLLYILLNLITKDIKVALLASLFFALHPVNVEAVSCISFREDLLAFLFMVSSFIVFIKSNLYAGVKKAVSYLSSVFLFFLALFSKEMAVMFPFVLALYDYYFVYKGNRKEFLADFKSRYGGYVAVILFFLWVWFFPMGNVKEMIAKYPGGSFYLNILTISKVVATYIRWLFVPINIHMSIPDVGYVYSLAARSLFDLDVLFSLSLIVLCLAAAIKLRREFKVVSFSILWFFITLVPVLNIFPIGMILAGHFLYIPSVGFCLLSAILLVRLPSLTYLSLPAAVLNKIRTDIIIVIIIFYSMFTVVGNLFWKNNIALWLELARQHPNNALVNNNTGCEYNALGKNEKAIMFFKKALEIKPDFYLSHYNLGIAYYRLGMLNEAVSSYKKAIEHSPNFAQAYNNLGAAYRDLGNSEEAVSLYKKALEINPSYSGACYNLALIYVSNGQDELAAKYYNKARELGFSAAYSSGPSVSKSEYGDGRFN